MPTWKILLHQPLEHTLGLDGQDKLGLGLKLQFLHHGRDAIGPGAEATTIDRDLPFRASVLVDDNQLAGDLPSMFVGTEVESFAVDRQHRLHVVHNRVGLFLGGKGRLTPVVGLVIRLPLGRMTLRANQLHAHRQHLERLGKGLDGIDRQCANLVSTLQLEIPAGGAIPNIRQRANGQLHLGFLLAANTVVDFPCLSLDFCDNVCWFSGHNGSSISVGGNFSLVATQPRSAASLMDVTAARGRRRPDRIGT